MPSSVRTLVPRSFPRALALMLASLASVGLVRADDLPAPEQRYEIEASFDPSTHEVAGRVRIHFVNTSRAAIDALVLHLYLEAFRDDQSVFARESGGQLRGVTRKGRGALELGRLVIDGVDLLPNAERELVPGDRTQMRVPLARPLPPGESLDVTIDFTSRLPPLFARTGYERDFHVIAQWFPKLARLEPDGVWASFPYHGQGEFYADFARYEVRFTTPRGWVVAATGEKIHERLTRDGVERHYVAEPVHDFALVADRHLASRSSRCAGVTVRVLFPPGYAAASRRHLAVTCDGIAFFGRVYGAYPYPSITVVVPPEGAEGGAGMEYPTLFLTSGPWYARPLPVDEGADTTAHELAHQWFQGLVATNEVLAPFLDEGVTSWAAYDFLRTRDVRASDHFFEALRAIALARRTPPPAHPAWEFDSSGYGASVYGRSSLVLETVARTYGRARLRATLGAYARAFRFGHPSADDFFTSFQASYGPAFVRDVLRPAFVEGATTSASVRTRRNERGREWLVEREGTLALPLVIRIETRTGSRDVRLPGTGVRYVIRDPRVLCVEVDPDHHSLLDARRVDDRVCLPSRRRSGWFDKLLAVVGFVFAGIGP